MDITDSKVGTIIRLKPLFKPGCLIDLDNHPLLCLDVKDLHTKNRIYDFVIITDQIHKQDTNLWKPKKLNKTEPDSFYDLSIKKYPFLDKDCMVICDTLFTISEKDLNALSWNFREAFPFNKAHNQPQTINDGVDMWNIANLIEDLKQSGRLCVCKINPNTKKFEITEVGSRYLENLHGIITDPDGLYKPTHKYYRINKQQAEKQLYNDTKTAIAQFTKTKQSILPDKLLTKDR